MYNSTVKQVYVSPIVETMTVRVERGFQGSGSTAPGGVNGSSSTTSYGQGAIWS